MAVDPQPIHPELRPFSRFMPRIPFRPGNLGLIRRLMQFQPKPRLPAGMQVENRCIPGPDAGQNLRLRIYRSGAVTAPAPALVWMHGGGYIIGRPEMNDPFLIQFAGQVPLVVVSVDYRLAPEHPFPAPLEDCYAALKWVHDHPGELGIDPGRIAVGGESAGGGLAAALAQVAHDRGEVKLIFQMLVYPMLDDRSAVCPDLAGQDWIAWTQADNRLGWESYLNQPCGAGDLPAYAVPARRTDLSGLPPAWICAGTLDMFHGEDAAYALKLSRAGVACEWVEIPGAFHGFDVLGPRLKLVAGLRRSQVAALRQYLQPEN